MPPRKKTKLIARIDEWWHFGYFYHLCCMFCSIWCMWTKPTEDSRFKEKDFIILNLTKERVQATILLNLRLPKTLDLVTLGPWLGIRFGYILDCIPTSQNKQRNRSSYFTWKHYVLDLELRNSFVLCTSCGCGVWILCFLWFTKYTTGKTDQLSRNPEKMIYFEFRHW